MLILSRFVIISMIYVVLWIGLSPASTAGAWTLRFAPLAETAPQDEGLASSPAVPITPQFFRFVVVRQQVTLGIEAPYIRDVKLVPPVRFKPLPQAEPSPAASAHDMAPRHHLRGPEARLLRRPHPVMSHALP